LRIESSGSGSRVEGAGGWGQDLESRDERSKHCESQDRSELDEKKTYASVWGFRVWVTGLRVKDLGLRVWGEGSGVEGLGFRV